MVAAQNGPQTSFTRVNSSGFEQQFSVLRALIYDEIVMTTIVRPTLIKGSDTQKAIDR